MNHSQTMKNWIIDASLYIGFMLMFFTKLTGTALHQLLGVIAGALAMYHLARHWNWVKAVSRRLSGSTSRQARQNYLVDAALLAGFSAILVSGLVISTWLSLASENASRWSDFHRAASEAT